MSMGSGEGRDGAGSGRYGQESRKEERKSHGRVWEEVEVTLGGS